MYHPPPAMPAYMDPVHGYNPMYAYHNHQTDMLHNSMTMLSTTMSAMAMCMMEPQLRRFNNRNHHQNWTQQNHRSRANQQNNRSGWMNEERRSHDHRRSQQQSRRNHRETTNGSDSDEPSDVEAAMVNEADLAWARCLEETSKRVSTEKLAKQKQTAQESAAQEQLSSLSPLKEIPEDDILGTQTQHMKELNTDQTAHTSDVTSHQHARQTNNESSNVINAISTSAENTQAQMNTTNQDPNAEPSLHFLGSGQTAAKPPDQTQPSL